MRTSFRSFWVLDETLPSSYLHDIWRVVNLIKASSAVVASPTALRPMHPRTIWYQTFSCEIGFRRFIGASLLIGLIYGRLSICCDTLRVPFITLQWRHRHTLSLEPDIVEFRVPRKRRILEHCKTIELLVITMRSDRRASRDQSANSTKRFAEDPSTSRAERRRLFIYNRRVN